MKSNSFTTHGVVTACALVLIPWLQSVATSQDRGGAAASGRTWVTAWGTSQQTLGDTAITNATVRLIARVTVPGDAVRVRLDNGFGTEAVRIARAYVGARIQGAAIAAGSNRPITVDGKSEVTLPPGGSVWSDPIRIPVLAQQDLAVSLFIPGMNVKPSQHTAAAVTSYRSADGTGDVASEEGRAAFTVTTTSLWWLKAIDVQADASARAIVAFGDSITDGYGSTVDANRRWPDLLAERLKGRAAVANTGISGNRVLTDSLAISASRRWPASTATCWRSRAQPT
jgi:GDSL-like Lipase/Acylhydrolase family